MWAAGLQFAARYFGLGSQSKLATVAEIAALQAVGLSTVALAEQWGNSSLEGYYKGVSHAIAVRDDLDAKGVPGNRPVYFAVDFDVQAYQWEDVKNYFFGINSILPLDRIGIYGGYNAMAWAQRDGAAKWFFQTYAWSGGKVHPATHFLQYSNNHYIGGGQVDYCRSLQNDFGQWGGMLIPATPPPAGPPPVVDAGGWDYAGDIQGVAGDDSSLGTSLDGYARDLDGLRNY